jgi:hypothetical protein
MPSDCRLKTGCSRWDSTGECRRAPIPDIGGTLGRLSGVPRNLTFVGGRARGRFIYLATTPGQRLLPPAATGRCRPISAIRCPGLTAPKLPVENEPRPPKESRHQQSNTDRHSERCVCNHTAAAATRRSRTSTQTPTCMGNSTLEQLTQPTHNLQCRPRADLGPCWALPMELEIPMPREPHARKAWTALSSAMQKASSFFVAPCALFGDPAR